MDEDGRVPASMALDAWLDKLSQASGAPGGGAACGVMLGVSAALLRMVANYTPDDPRASACADRLVERRRAALAAAEADGIRSAELGAALALPDDPHRGGRVRDAAIAASRSSATLGEVGEALLEELRLLSGIGNPHLDADLAIAGEALAAGLAGASVNLRANVQLARAHLAADRDARDAIESLAARASRLRAARLAAAAIAQAESARFDAD